MPQCAISSLAFASGAIATAAGVGYVFGRPAKTRNSSRLSVHSMSTISISSKSPFKRFKLFLSKHKHLSPTKNILQSTTIHPLMVHLDNLVDDDISSTYSDVTSVYTMDRKISSTPNIPGVLAQAFDSSSAVASFNPRARSSLPSLPISITPPPKFRHNRSNSLPPTAFSRSFYRQPTPSESWDDDFDLDDEINVPNSVEQAQFSLRMDITNIRDFVSQIEELKVLRNKKQFLASTIQSKITRKWSNGFTKSKKKSKKYKDLESRFKQDWEEVAVIIDLSDVAKDRQPTFDGGKRVAVDIEKIPSERHMQSRRKENFRISVEVMPSLIDHLKKLQDRLSEHVDKLGALATVERNL
ncbi:1372_t:CDS:2 [Cetraspora pellucida]|uniref:1372_t:CDS:1 n=1 Tax=Cetraspora pellucida TaxID=1433469 RepID=A0A9N9AVV4_9GLOM|nr:1372_t:CDS:2 [Cetraspora pellucida]